jgi:hypothetical protein
MSSNTLQGIRADPKISSFLEISKEISFSNKVQGKFLLLKYEYDKNREEEFCEFILDTLFTYSLSKEERDQLNNNTARKLVKLALSRYVNYRKEFKGGEIGEIILFHLLELLENAVQIANKMCLKTSGNVPYHGADAIHFGIDGDLRILFLGEAKIGKSFNTTLNAALKSIYDYRNNEKQEFEIKLALGHLSDDLSDEIKKEIQDYLNPLKEDLKNFSQVYAIFLGFEKSVLKEFEKRYQGEELIKKVVDYYHKEIDSYILTIKEKVEEKEEFENLRFLFYLLPFKDLDKIRKKFLEGINVIP